MNIKHRLAIGVIVMGAVACGDDGVADMEGVAAMQGAGGSSQGTSGTPQSMGGVLMEADPSNPFADAMEVFGELDLLGNFTVTQNSCGEFFAGTYQAARSRTPVESSTDLALILEPTNPGSLVVDGIGGVEMDGSLGMSFHAQLPSDFVQYNCVGTFDGNSIALMCSDPDHGIVDCQLAFTRDP